MIKRSETLTLGTLAHFRHFYLKTPDLEDELLFFRQLIEIDHAKTE
jgi:hypothetical protein